MPDEPPVWMTRVLEDTGNLRPIDYHVEGGRDASRAFQLRASTRHMKPWGDVTLPDLLFYARPKPRSYRDNLPDTLIIIDGIPAVSECMRDLLTGFRLGEVTHFHETPLFEVDQTTRQPERIGS